MAAPSSTPAALKFKGLDRSDILNGLEEKEFYLTYQPQVCAGTGELVGLEALMRWNALSLGSIVPPDIFILVAEQSDVINHMWTYLLDQISCDRQRLDSINKPDVHLSINVSAAQLPQKALSTHFGKWLDKFKIDGSQIHIEITESALLANTSAVTENLINLNSMGVNLWLDDFGTGYSSLRNMRDLPISGLKIDKSFVSDIVEDLDDFRIVSAIIAMSNSLGLRTVAEGVETDPQAQILTQLGCDILQGYLFGNPESLDTIARCWFGESTGNT